MIAIINGPNLNLQGIREKNIYGSESFQSFLPKLRNFFPNTSIEFFQSNSEGEIIDKIHQLGFNKDFCEGIVINPGAYAHYSYAIADAIRAVEVPVVEVHISNIASREDFRKLTVTGASCRGIISGFGLKGYILAVEALLK